METLWYEFKPWAFVVFASLAMLRAPNSGLLIGSGALLILSASAIIGARFYYRLEQRER